MRLQQPHCKRTSGGFICARGDVGEIEVINQPDGCYVRYVEVDPEHQRSGIATSLYEAAAKTCWRRRKPLRSGFIVSSAALTFWEKQYKKGRATRSRSKRDSDPGIEDDWYNKYRYTLRTPPSSTLRAARRRRRQPGAPKAR